ncbi:MAG: EamA family transporter [Syntrophales bacterium]
MSNKTTSATSSGKPFLALAFLSVIWGYNWVVMKEGLRFCDPFVFAAIRVAMASVFMFAILLWSKKPIRPRQVKWTVLLGLLSTTFGLGLPVWALVSGGAGKTAILLYTMPFWVILLAWPILGEKMRGLDWLAVILAFTGLGLMVDFHAVGAKLWSSIIAVIAGVSWAGSAIVTRIMRRNREFDLLSVTTWQMIYGAAPLIIISLILPASPIQWTPVFIVALSYNVILVSVIAFLLWFYILERLPAGMATMGTLATPVIAIVAAALQLGEIPSPRETAGIILILSGIGFLSAVAILRTRRLRRIQ